MIEATVIILFLFLAIAVDAVLHGRNRQPVHSHLWGSAPFEDRDAERVSHDIQAIRARRRR